MFQEEYRQRVNEEIRTIDADRVPFFGLERSSQVPEAVWNTLRPDQQLFRYYNRTLRRILGDGETSLDTEDLLRILYPAPQRALTVRSGMNARKHVGKAGCGVPQGAPQVYAEKPRP